MELTRRFTPDLEALSALGNEKKFLKASQVKAVTERLESLFGKEVRLTSNSFSIRD